MSDIVNFICPCTNRKVDGVENYKYQQPSTFQNMIDKFIKTQMDDNNDATSNGDALVDEYYPNEYDRFSEQPFFDGSRGMNSNNEATRARPDTETTSFYKSTPMHDMLSESTIAQYDYFNESHVNSCEDNEFSKSLGEWVDMWSSTVLNDLLENILKTHKETSTINNLVIFVLYKCLRIVYTATLQCQTSRIHEAIVDEATELLQPYLNADGRSKYTPPTMLAHPEEFKNPSSFLKLYGDPLCTLAQTTKHHSINHNPLKEQNGNWVCKNEKCKNLNFPRRFKCFRCQTRRDAEGDKKVGLYARQVFQFLKDLPKYALLGTNNDNSTDCNPVHNNNDKDDTSKINYNTGVYDNIRAVKNNFENHDNSSPMRNNHINKPTSGKNIDKKNFVNPGNINYKPKTNTSENSTKVRNNRQDKGKVANTNVALDSSHGSKYTCSNKNRDEHINETQPTTENCGGNLGEQRYREIDSTTKPTDVKNDKITNQVDVDNVNSSIFAKFHATAAEKKLPKNEMNNYEICTTDERAGMFLMKTKKKNDNHGGKNNRTVNYRNEQQSVRTNIPGEPGTRSNQINSCDREKNYNICTNESDVTTKERIYRLGYNNIINRDKIGGWKNFVYQDNKSKSDSAGSGFLSFIPNAKIFSANMINNLM